MRPLGQRSHVVSTALIPPSGSKATGEVIHIHGAERQVYKRLRPLEARSHVIEVKDDSGKVIFQPAPQGATPRPLRNRITTIPEDHPDAYEEFILLDDGIGTVHIVTTFREDPATIRARKNEERRQRTLDAVLDRLSDMDPDEVAAFMAKVKEPVTEEDEEEEEAEAPFRMKRNVPGKGYWVEGPDGKMHDEPLEKRAAEKLLQSLTAPTPVS